MTVRSYRPAQAAVDEAVRLGLLVREQRLFGGVVAGAVRVTDLGKRMWVLLEAFRDLPEEDSDGLQ